MKIEKLFLKLFTSSVRQTQWNTDDLMLENNDWSRLLTLSAFHQVIPLLYEAVCKTEPFLAHPPAVAGMWKRETVLAVARQTRMTDEFLRLYREMCSCGLEPLVLKGLVCRNLYPKPDYRMSSDEDLLIPKEDFWKMDRFLCERGFYKNESDESLKAQMSTLHEVGYHNPKTGLYLEIHLTLFSEESGAYGHLNGLFKDLHNDRVAVEVGEQTIWTLGYTEHMLFLLCHSVKHFLHSGFGVRQLMDMVLFAETYGSQIDWKKLIRICKKNHMYVFLIHLFDLGVHYFGFDPKKACWPVEGARLDGTRNAEDLLHDLLAGGIYGSSTEERRHSSNITLAAAQRKKRKGGVFAALFPEPSYMMKKYPYVKKHPWALPAAWIRRIADHMKENNYVNNRKIVETGYGRVKLLKKYGIIQK